MKLKVALLVLVSIVLFVMLSGCPEAECGNGICERWSESGITCPQDCGEAPLSPVCGDGSCDSGENCENCPADCGQCQEPPTNGNRGEEHCGNEEVDEGENCSNCPEDVSCGEDEECVDGACQEVEKTFQDKIEDCQQLESYIQRDNCLVNLGKEEKNVSVCPILEVFSKNSCYSEIAVLTGDDSICSNITEESSRNSCYYDVSVITNEEIACSSITFIELKDDCLKNIGMQTADEEICQRISSSNKKDYCFYEIAKQLQDESICTLISARYVGGAYLRDECYLSIEGVDATVCGKLLDPTKVIECYNNAATTSLDKSICDLIDEWQPWYDCLYYVATNLPDYEICLELDVNSQPCVKEIIENYSPVEKEVCDALKDLLARDNCYYDIAVEDLNISLCREIITGRNLKNECIYEVAISLNEPNYCEELSRNSIIRENDCYLELAKNNQNPGICEEITTYDKYVACYSDIAIEVSQPEVCSSVQVERFVGKDYSTKDMCYYNYAIGKADSSYCEMIINDILRESCIDELETS